MLNVPVYVVSRRCDTGRRGNVAAQMAAIGLSFEWVDAVDWRTDVLPVVDTLVWQMSSASISMALSHRAAYRRMMADGHSMAVVVEDDVRWLAALPVAVLAALRQQGGWDVLLLGYSHCKAPHIVKHIPVRSRFDGGGYYAGGATVVHGLLGTVCYAVTAAGAAKMLAMPLETLADDWMRFERHYGVTVWHLRPLIAEEADLKTTRSG